MKNNEVLKLIMQKLKKRFYIWAFYRVDRHGTIWTTKKT